MLFPNIPMRVTLLARAKNTKSGYRVLDQKKKSGIESDTYMFPRQLEPIQDEKCQYRLSIFAQYPNEYDKDYVHD